MEFYFKPYCTDWIKLFASFFFFFFFTCKKNNRQVLEPWRMHLGLGNSFYILGKTQSFLFKVLSDIIFRLFFSLVSHGKLQSEYKKMFILTVSFFFENLYIKLHYIRYSVSSIQITVSSFLYLKAVPSTWIIHRIYTKFYV